MLGDDGNQENVSVENSFGYREHDNKHSKDLSNRTDDLSDTARNNNDSDLDSRRKDNIRNKLEKEGSDSLKEDLSDESRNNNDSDRKSKGKEKVKNKLDKEDSDNLKEYSSDESKQDNISKGRENPTTGDNFFEPNTEKTISQVHVDVTVHHVHNSTRTCNSILRFTKTPSDKHLDSATAISILLKQCNLAIKPAFEDILNTLRIFHLSIGKVIESEGFYGREDIRVTFDKKMKVGEIDTKDGITPEIEVPIKIVFNYHNPEFEPVRDSTSELKQESDVANSDYNTDA